MPPLCCIKSVTATQEDIPVNKIIQAKYVVTGRRTIDFVATMGNVGDVNGIHVIQYYKNESFTKTGGVKIPTTPGPKNSTWHWTAGADDYLVDSSRDIRCWSEDPAVDGRALKKDATNGTITWNDTPGVDLKAIDDEVSKGNLQSSDFPLSFSLDFKTDILCTDQKLCDHETAAFRTATEPAWKSQVIASITWSFSVQIKQMNSTTKGIVAVTEKPNEPQIKNISITYYKKCP